MRIPSSPAAEPEGHRVGLYPCCRVQLAPAHDDVPHAGLPALRVESQRASPDEPLLHTASVILLFLVLRRMTGFLWRAAFVAAVFAIHPLRVESVAWVANARMC